jgi:hypothetical protein
MIIPWLLPLQKWQSNALDQAVPLVGKVDWEVYLRPGGSGGVD